MSDKPERRSCEGCRWLKWNDASTRRLCWKWLEVDLVGRWRDFKELSPGCWTAPEEERGAARD